MNYVYGVPSGHRRVWTSEPPTIALSETPTIFASEVQPEPQLQTKGDAPVGAQQKYTEAEGLEICRQFVRALRDADNLQWLRDEAAKLKAQPPSAAEFSLLVEAEIAKGLTEVEALHVVASEYPEFYDAYRESAFTDGHL